MTTVSQALQAMRSAGIIFDNAQNLITKANIDKLAMDAAPLMTAPNAGVPYVMTAYVDPAIIPVLTAPRNSREIFGEVKKGDWTTPSAIFKTIEMTGKTEEYTDYGNGGMADVNANYPERENYVAQTHIRYGARELDTYGKAALDLASLKQQSAANIIDTDANKFNLLGVEGKDIYGLLNEPNLPATLTPATVNTDVTKWEDKTTKDIFNDILALAAELFANSQGYLNAKSDLVFVCPPAVDVLLGKATDYNVSVMDMMTKYFKNIRFVSLPEMATEGGNMVMLLGTSILGNKVGEYGYSEKMRAFPLIQKSSSWEQKFAFGSYGFICYYPYAIASMTGV